MTLYISKFDNNYIKIDSDEKSELRHLYDTFAFKAENYRFMPLYKSKVWDGNVRLFNLTEKTIYSGLRDKVIEWARDNKYAVNAFDCPDENFSVNEANNFLDTLNLSIKPRDYQVEYFVHAVRKRRCVLMAPTSSGKSSLVYFITRYLNKKTLIIVPNIQLVEQLYKDFYDYGHSEHNIQKISQDYSKKVTHDIVISTYQSIFRKPASWFKDFEMVMVDECHTAKSASIINIFKKCAHVEYRIGLTGTLSKNKLNNHTIEGLFGPVKRLVTTRDLMENNYISQLEIKCIKLNYKAEMKQTTKAWTYHDELNFLISHNARNFFISNLALSFNNNVLILYTLVDKHGKLIYDDIVKRNKNKQVFFVSGKVDAQERERIKAVAENNNDVIIVASFGTFQQGINIVNLHHVIFASPTKSKIRSLQSIGRGLRKGLDKSKCILYDIYDDFGRKNFSLAHFQERLKIYQDEQFIIKQYTLTLEKS